MNSTVGERIQALLDTLGLKKARFAEMIGVDPSYISLIVGGTRIPSDRLLTTISHVFSVRYDWLKDGTGEMLEDGATTALADPLISNLSPRERALVKSYAALTPQARAAVITFIEECAKNLNVVPPEPPEQSDVSAKLAALEQQNAELLRRIEAIEKEDALTDAFRSIGSYFGTENEKSPRR